MGIYLPNMEMPKEGSWITLRVYPDWQCFLYSWRGNDIEFIEQLTAVPVPEPHGRLGDLDALPWYLANTSVKYATYEDWEMLCDAIAAAPTVIPASEEGEA